LGATPQRTTALDVVLPFETQPNAAGWYGSLVDKIVSV
jgi:hypothetical protein